MKKLVRIILLTLVGLIIIFIIMIKLTGKEIYDVYLKDFKILENNKTILINVGTSSRGGYIRKMKKTTGSDNTHLTFYSTYGFNLKMGSSETYKIKLNDNTNEIYFYIGNNKYKRVLLKDINTNTWIKDNSNEIHSELNDLKNVTISIKNGTLTEEKAVIIIKGINECDELYKIDKYEDEKWKEVKEIIDDYESNYPLHTRNENGQIELDINWSSRYGKLEKGKYRIVKELAKGKYNSVEFTID